MYVPTWQGLCENGSVPLQRLHPEYPVNCESKLISTRVTTRSFETRSGLSQSVPDDWVSSAREAGRGTEVRTGLGRDVLALERKQELTQVEVQITEGIPSVCNIVRCQGRYTGSELSGFYSPMLTGYAPAE